MVLPSERVPWVNKHDVCRYVCNMLKIIFLSPELKALSFIADLPDLKDSKTPRTRLYSCSKT